MAQHFSGSLIFRIGDIFCFESEQIFWNRARYDFFVVIFRKWRLRRLFVVPLHVNCKAR